jgi:hypothetical protein
MLPPFRFYSWLWPIPSDLASCKPLTPKRQHNGLCDLGSGKFTGSQRLENCAVSQSGQSNPLADISRGGARRVPGTGRGSGNWGVALPIVEATTPEELDIAFASAAVQHADAIMVFSDDLTNRQAPRESRATYAL